MDLSSFDAASRAVQLFVAPRAAESSEKISELIEGLDGI